MNDIRFKLILLGCLLVLISGCSNNLGVAIKAAEQSNKGFPVVLRIYQLKNETSFQSASSNSIWNQDEKILEQDYISKTETIIHPGETKRVEFAVNKSTQYIAVCADFNEPHSELWRDVFSYESVKGKELWIVCGEDRIKVVKK